MEIEESAPAPEAAPEVAEPVVESTEPVVEAAEPVEGSEPVVETEALEPVVEEPADPFAEFGGREAIEAAHRLYEASRTEDGVIQLFLDAGRNLGLSLKDMQAFFEAQGGPVEEVEEEDLDEPVTRRELREAEQRRQQEAAEKRAAEQRTQHATVVRSVVADLNVPEKSVQAVLALADQHMKGEPNTESITAAIRAGWADFQAEAQVIADRILAEKREQAAKVPSAPSGAAAPATAEEPEPQNAMEAIKRVRERLRNGTL